MKTVRIAFLLSAIASLSCATAGLAAPGSSVSVQDITEPKKLLEVTFVEPDTVSEEEGKVLQSLKAIYEAYLRGDWATFEKHLDPSCTKYDGDTKLRFTGSKAIIERMQLEMANYLKSDSPLVSYTIDHPYARINGDMATVTFVAIRVFGGKHPATYESHCSDIFLKEDGMWKKVYYRSNWKLVK
jgi:hypothetical protein